MILSNFLESERMEDKYQDELYTIIREKDEKIGSFQFTIRKNEIYPVLKALSETETGIPIGLEQFKTEYDRLLSEGYDNFLTKLSNEQIDKYFPDLDVSSLHDQVICKLIKNNIEYVFNHIDNSRLQQITNIITGRSNNYEKKVLINTANDTTDLNLLSISKCIIDKGICFGAMFINEYFKYVHDNGFNFEKIPEETKQILSSYRLSVLCMSYRDKIDFTFINYFIREYSELMYKCHGDKKWENLLKISYEINLVEPLYSSTLFKIVKNIYNVDIYQIFKSNKSTLYKLKSLEVIKKDCDWLYNTLLTRNELNINWYHKILLKVLN